MEQLLISLVSGAVGGNVAGAVLKKFNLGLLGNSLAGIVGGGLGSQILGMIGAGSMAAGGMAAGEMAGGLDVGALLGQVASGGVGGGVVMVVVGFIKQMMAK